MDRTLLARCSHSRSSRRPRAACSLLALLCALTCGATIEVNELSGDDAPPDWPLTTGVPFRDGELFERDLARWGLEASSSRVLVPVQFEVRGTYPESGSIRWLGVSFQARPGSSSYDIRRLNPEETPPAHPFPIQVTQTTKSIDVTTGSLRVRVPRSGPRMLTFAKWNGVTALANRDVNNFLRHANGDLYTEGNLAATLELEGPLHSVVRVDGDYLNPGTGAPTCRFTARMHFYAGQPMIQIVHTFTWVGSQDALQIGELALRFAVGPTIVGGQAAAAADPAEGWVTTPLRRAERLALHQDVHAHWGQRQSYYAVDRPGAGSVLTLAEGARAGNWISGSGSALGVTLALRELWQQFPKKLQVDPANGRIEAYLWAPEGGALDLRPPALEAFWGPSMTAAVTAPGSTLAAHYDDLKTNPSRIDPTGLAKTHELLLIFHAAPADAAVQRATDAFEHPPVALVDRREFGATQVLEGLAPPNPAAYPELESALSKENGDALHVMDDWGDYGFYAYGQGPHLDYENGSVLVLPSRYTNVDFGYEVGIWRAFLRSGDPALFRAAVAHTRFVNDVMLCHDERSPSRRKGTWWWNPRFPLIPWVGLNTSTWLGHDSSFGFSMEHALLHYYLTGDRRSLDVFEEYAATLKAYVQAGGDASFAAQQVASSHANRSRHLFQRMEDLALAYLQLGDRWFRDRAVELAELLLAPDQVGGIRYEPENAGEEPAPYPVYFHYKVSNIVGYAQGVGGAERGKAMASLERLADWYFVTYTENGRVQESRGVGPVSALGYRLTGDVKHLAFGLDILRQRHNATLLDEGVLVRGSDRPYHSIRIVDAGLFPSVNANDPDTDVVNAGELKSRDASDNGPYLATMLEELPRTTAEEIYQHHVGPGQSRWLPAFHKPYGTRWVASPETTLLFVKEPGVPLEIEHAASRVTTRDPDGAPFDPAWFGPSTSYTVNLRGLEGFPSDQQFLRANPLQRVSVTIPAWAAAGTYALTVPEGHQLTLFRSSAPFTTQ